MFVATTFLVQGDASHIAYDAQPLAEQFIADHEEYLPTVRQAAAAVRAANEKAKALEAELVNWTPGISETALIARLRLDSGKQTPGIEPAVIPAQLQARYAEFLARYQALVEESRSALESLQSARASASAKILADHLAKKRVDPKHIVGGSAFAEAEQASSLAVPSDPVAVSADRRDLEFAPPASKPATVDGEPAPSIENPVPAKAPASGKLTRLLETWKRWEADGGINTVLTRHEIGAVLGMAIASRVVAPHGALALLASGALLATGVLCGFALLERRARRADTGWGALTAGISLMTAAAVAAFALAWRFGDADGFAGLLVGGTLGGVPLHELGHYLAGILSGARTAIKPHKRIFVRSYFLDGTRAQRIVFLLGGPVVNLLLAGVAFAASGPAAEFLKGFAFINLALGIGALLPISLNAGGGLALRLIVEAMGARRSRG